MNTIEKGQTVPALLRTETLFLDTQIEMETKEPDLSRQLAHFLDNRSKILHDHAPNGDYDRRGDEFVRKMYMDIVLERNQRAEDFTTDELNEVYDILQELFVLTPYGASCIDSRVMRTIVYGLPLRFGGFSRIPTGDLPEFVPGKGGKLVLHEGNFSDQLQSAFLRDNKIVQLLDSHLECAARGGLEKRKGKDPKDEGLYMDVLKKKKIAQAMQDYVDERFPGKVIVPIQTSFNPESGFMYMGLETEEALEAAKKEGFTHNVLGKLEGRGEIINTESFMEDEVIKGLFEGNRIESFSWVENYRKSTIEFWKNIKKMHDNGATKHIVDSYLSKIYSDVPDDELNERAVFLLANAYNANLLTDCGKKKFPYREHEESCVVISEGENGPYGKNPSFSVYSGLEDHLVDGVLLSAGIIRTNREKGRIEDYTAIYKNKEEYLQAPVPMVLKAIIREEVDWKTISKIDWSDMPEDWSEMTDHQFKRYISQKYTSIPLPVFDAINFLRNKMKKIYQDSEASEQIFGGNIAIMPMLVDANRRLWSIVPFVSSGYDPRSAVFAA